MQHQIDKLAHHSHDYDQSMMHYKYIHLALYIKEGKSFCMYFLQLLWRDLDLNISLMTKYMSPVRARLNGLKIWEIVVTVNNVN